MVTRAKKPKRKPAAKRVAQESTTLDALQLDPDNVATHDDRNLAVIGSSLQQLGAARSIVLDAANRVICGNGTVEAARGGDRVKRVVIVDGDGDTLIAVRRKDLTPEQARAVALADNRSSDLHGYDVEALQEQLATLGDFDLDALGFAELDLDDIAGWNPTATDDEPADDDEPEPEVTDDLVQKAARRFKVKTGDLWSIQGEHFEHRLLCGDSTNAADIARLFGDDKAALVHADPPYGMGKQSDGVANDNLYRDKLDAFQMAWWSTIRPHVLDNGSAYVWGNAEDLWRLWFVGGLGQSERLTLRNEIVWDKQSIAGMASELMTQYPIASERALFFQFGDQFLGNVNADQYWEGWDEIRLPLVAEAKAAGLTSKRCREITGTNMYGHWFSKSQWAFINEAYYNQLAAACPGHFEQPWAELRAVYDRLRGGFRSHINGIVGGMRSYFDNGHDIMRDVWTFSRVFGEERCGHATPKPVAMAERAIVSSCPEGGIVVEPFIGTGTTMLGAERTGRRCFGVELQPDYVAVSLQRLTDAGCKPRRIK